MKNFIAILREPLVHFFSIGVILFMAYFAIHGNQTDKIENSEAETVLIDDKQIDHLEMTWEQLWKRKPTKKELERLLNDFVREELLYREALALGLDENDTIVRRRMAQKMAFLSKGINVKQAESDTLKAWYQERKEMYTLPPLVSFSHVFFSKEKRGNQVESDAANAQAELGEKQPDSLESFPGDRSMIRNHWDWMSQLELTPLFGDSFAKSVMDLKPGEWSSPMESKLGFHLVYVTSKSEKRIPDFDEVETRIQLDWMQEQARLASDKMLGELIEKYNVKVSASARNRLGGIKVIGGGSR